MKFKIKNHIVFEDDHLIVVNKPANLLVIPDRAGVNTNLKVLLETYIKQDIFIVHRLDKATSGLVVFAKNAVAHQKLNQQFQQRTVIKKYYALVNGRLKEDKGDIELPLTIKSNASKTVVDLKGGKPSHTSYEVIDTFSRYTLLDITLHTGRMHQIRVHFAGIGHPLAIDSLYGENEAIYLSSIKRNYRLGKGAEERPLMDSLTLHSYFLAFEHPETRATLTNKIDMPKNFRVLLNKLGDV